MKRTLREAKARDETINTVLNAHKHNNSHRLPLLVLGMHGSGKTTFMRHFTTSSECVNAKRQEVYMYVLKCAGIATRN